MRPGHALLRGRMAGGGGGFDTSAFHHTSLYTGDGSTPRVISGVDLSGGGIAWSKRRDASGAHALSFSTDGASVYTADVVASSTPATGGASFGSTGETLLSTTNQNVSAETYVNWQFRKMAGYLDVVAYTGNGANRTIVHALGVEPAAIIIFRIGGTGSRRIYHRDYGGGGYTDWAANGRYVNNSTFWNSTAAAATHFSLGTNSNVNSSGVAYIAILFAHNPAAGISAFSYVGTGTDSNPEVTLGWDPRFILYLGTSGPTGSSQRPILDTVRSPGFIGNDYWLRDGAHTDFTPTESVIELTGSGFTVVHSSQPFGTSGVTYHGVAIG